MSFPKSQYLERFDGIFWRLFDIDGGNVVLTESGLRHIHNFPKILEYVSRYKRCARNNVQNKGYRNYLRSGGNSDVFYTEEFSIAIKEASTSHSVWNSLQRMDYIYFICKKYLPAHITVPEHYAAVFSRELKKQYLFMELANLGQTVEEAYENPNIDDGLKYLVIQDIDYAHNVISEIARFNYPGSNLLADWHEGNIVIDLNKETDKRPYTLYIIDQ